MVRVVLADDQELVRTGFRMILRAEEDFEVVGEAADGEEAVAQVARLRPDVVLMDIRMPRVDGLAATRRILEQPTRTRVLILTTFDQDEYVFQALRAGASGVPAQDRARRPAGGRRARGRGRRGAAGAGDHPPADRAVRERVRA